MNTTTKSRLAGLPDGLDNGQRAMLATGNGYKASILSLPADCQPWPKHCMAQVAYHLAMAERWLDLASEVRP